MEPILSGTTTERIARTGLLMILVSGYAAWSLVDGNVRYPQANVISVFEDHLGIEPPEPLPVINPELTEQQVPEIAVGEPLDAVATRLGTAPFNHSGAAYFFGDGGFVRLELRDDRVLAGQWIHGPKYSATSLRTQRIIGYVLAPIGFLFILQFVRVVTTRVSLTDAGLKVQGKPLIPFEAMTGVRIGKAAGLSSEVAAVDYTLNGLDGTVRLNSYVVNKQADIITAICEKKGFPQPEKA
jgi:hypothetical protein